MKFIMKAIENFIEKIVNKIIEKKLDDILAAKSLADEAGADAQKKLSDQDIKDVLVFLVSENTENVRLINQLCDVVNTAVTASSSKSSTVQLPPLNRKSTEKPN